MKVIIAVATMAVSSVFADDWQEQLDMIEQQQEELKKQQEYDRQEAEFQRQQTRSEMDAISGQLWQIQLELQK
jgi:hypothetical protein